MSDERVEIQRLTAQLEHTQVMANAALSELDELKRTKIYRLATWYWRARTWLRGPGARPAPAPLQTGPRFMEAVLQHHEPNRGYGMYLVWLKYGLDSNQRGQRVLERMREVLGRDVSGLHHLDLGCAYGGTCLAFANAGAVSVGIDVDATALELAQLNCLDHPHLPVRLMHRDVTQPGAVSDLGQFDVITCDNVIEHVLDVPSLLRAIVSLLKPKGVCHLVIPNAWSVAEIARDGHFGQFGISLLPHDRARDYFHAAGFNSEYSVGHFFKLPQYEALFEGAGLSLRLIGLAPDTSEQVDQLCQQVTGLAAQLQNELRAGHIPPSVADDVSQAVSAHVQEFDRRYERYTAAAGPDAQQLRRELLCDYACDFWLTVAIRAGQDR